MMNMKSTGTSWYVITAEAGLVFALSAGGYSGAK